MRILIVEDDLISRRILQEQLASFWICEIAVNGRKATKAFSQAWGE
jgi:CheY-like chemotaxis protein